MKARLSVTRHPRYVLSIIPTALIVLDSAEAPIPSYYSRMLLRKVNIDPNDLGLFRPIDLEWKKPTAPPEKCFSINIMS